MYCIYNQGPLPALCVPALTNKLARQGVASGTCALRAHCLPPALTNKRATVVSRPKPKSPSAPPPQIWCGYPGWHSPNCHCLQTGVTGNGNTIAKPRPVHLAMLKAQARRAVTHAPPIKHPAPANAWVQHMWPATK